MTIDPSDDCTFWYTGTYYPKRTTRTTGIPGLAPSDSRTALAGNKTRTVDG
jgi:hypothetical protein